MLASSEADDRARFESDLQEFLDGEDGLDDAGKGENEAEQEQEPKDGEGHILEHEVCRHAFTSGQPTDLSAELAKHNELKLSMDNSGRSAMVSRLQYMVFYEYCQHKKKLVTTPSSRISDELCIATMALKQVSNETSDTNAHGEVKKPSTKKTSTGRAPPHFWLVRMAPTTINDTMWPTAIRKKLIKLNTCSEPMLQYADHITPEKYLKKRNFPPFWGSFCCFRWCIRLQWHTVVQSC